MALAIDINPNRCSSVSSSFESISAGIDFGGEFFEEEWNISSPSLSSMNRPEALQSLKDVIIECSQKDWDGYGASPANPYSSSHAKRFLESFPTSFPFPEVDVDPDGEISFEWFQSSRHVFSISFGSRGELHYAGLFGDCKVRGVEFLRYEIPKAVFDQLERLYSPSV